MVYDTGPGSQNFYSRNLTKFYCNRCSSERKKDIFEPGDVLTLEIAAKIFYLIFTALTRYCNQCRQKNYIGSSAVTR